MALLRCSDSKWGFHDFSGCLEEKFPLFELLSGLGTAKAAPGALQPFSHCSCWEALLFSRNSLGTLRYGKVHLVSAARQNQIAHGSSVSAFPLLSQSLEVQGRLAWCGYVPLLFVKCLTCTSCCLKRSIWKQIFAARLGGGIKPATSCTSLQDFSSNSCSHSWTFCLCLLCFEDHALYLHLNILYFAHLKPKFFPFPLLLHQSTFTLCLTFMPHLCHYKTEGNQVLHV